MICNRLPVDFALRTAVECFVNKVRQYLEKINIRGTVGCDVPLRDRTSFRTGGSADVLAEPVDAADVARILTVTGELGISVFVLGAGANILVSDSGVRGVVMDMRGLSDVEIRGSIIHAGAGAAVSNVSSAAGERGLSGLAFIYGMPGSVGGSVWMNARCYGSSISDVLAYVDVVDPSGKVTREPVRSEDFGYKVSPYQSRSEVIVAAGFGLVPGDREALLSEMAEHRHDRESKGHYDAPSAGSVFKNDRAFGRPTGRLIDELGLKGYAVGGAEVSPKHGNIIINTGNATAADILALIESVERRVLDAFGFRLSREVLLVGEWGESRR